MMAGYLKSEALWLEFLTKHRYLARVPFNVYATQLHVGQWEITGNCTFDKVQVRQVWLLLTC